MCALISSKPSCLKMPTGPAPMISASVLTGSFTGDGQKLPNQLG
jgi:hypothetical protein